MTAVRGCRAAICDKVSQSARGSIIAITDLIAKRGNELREGDVSRYMEILVNLFVFPLTSSRIYFVFFISGYWLRRGLRHRCGGDLQDNTGFVWCSSILI